MTVEKSNDHSLESHDEHFESFGEIFVDQMIETIEYALGSISNTASYLRLWALSLAHGQLAKVFYTMILQSAVNNSTGILSSSLTLIIGYVFFFGATFAVIMCMDSMECFLHGLRLHWVEFQNKFFKGDGIMFVPFVHKIN